MFNDKKASSILILVISIIFALCLSGGLFYFYQKEHLNNVSLKQQLEDVKAKQMSTESKLEDAQKMMNSLKDRLEETQGKVTLISTELDAEKKSKEEAVAEVDRMKSELEQQKSLRSELEKKFKQAQDDIKASQDQLAELNTKKTELEVKVKDLETKSSDLEAKVRGIELGTIVVAPKQPAKIDNKAAQAAKKAEEQTRKDAEKAKKAEEKARKAAEKAQKAELNTKAKQVSKVIESPVVSAGETASVSKLEGSVVVVNKEYNFAVINLGSNDGVKSDAVFSIYRNDKYLGDVKVEKVHDAMSAAGFMTEGLKDKVAEGDKAILKK